MCATLGSIQGFYHLSFYVKYWLLNNTQMPLCVEVCQDRCNYDKMDLPYENKDFDDSLIRKMEDEDNEMVMQKTRKLRTASLETSVVLESADRRRTIGKFRNLRSNRMMRPWETVQNALDIGLLGALGQETLSGLG